MDARELAIRQKLKDDFEHYASKCLYIRTKAGSILPFLFNQAQKYVHTQVEKQKRETGRVRVIIVKGRQQGISTYVGGRIYHAITHRHGARAFIFTHHSEATNNLFEMSQRFHEYCPQIVRPDTSASSSKELVFGDLDSGYKVGTAGTSGAGRSSTIQYLHGSEVAFWPNAAEHSKGILQAVPNAANTEVFLESTANGIGNYFHEQWQLAESGQSDFLPIFLPWFWQLEYVRDVGEGFEAKEDEIELIQLYKLTAPQLMWRRYKIQELSAAGVDGSKSFDQEYPHNPIVAFSMTGEDTLIPQSLVMRAAKKVCEPVGDLVIGCDPARFGNDRTSIIYRRGRCAYNLKSYSKKSTMEIVGILHRAIISDKPTKVFIDVGGLGAGIVDRLIELGFKDVVVAVNAGESALYSELYANKRAEMWCNVKKWLEEYPVQIPDVDSLHSDLCGPCYSYDSLQRVVIEQKEKMKKRGLRSPDEADALCLTFAMPVIAKKQNNDDEIANYLMAKSQRVEQRRMASR